MDTAEILTKAADIIEQQGWSSGGGFFERPTGDDGLPDLSVNARTCPVCARGSIAVAVGQSPIFGDSPYLQTQAPAAAKAVAAAEDVFLGYLAAREGWDLTIVGRSGIDVWNDSEERDAEEVVAALRDCASRIRAA